MTRDNPSSHGKIDHMKNSFRVLGLDNNAAVVAGLQWTNDLAQGGSNDEDGSEQRSALAHFTQHILAINVL